MKNIKNGLIGLLFFVLIGVILSLFERSLWQILLVPGMVFSGLFDWLFLKNEFFPVRDFFQSSFLVAEFISVFFYYFIGILFGWAYGKFRVRKILK